MKNMKKARSFFIAIDLDDEKVVSRIRSFQKELSNKDFAEIQLAKDLHITLNFLGKLRWGEVNRIKDKLRSINMPSFEILLRSVKYFPSAKLPVRILWVGIKGLKIYALMEKVRSITLNPYVGDLPHITIARIRKINDIDKLMEFTKNRENYFFGEFHVHCFKLKANVNGKYIDVEKYFLF